MISTFLQKRKKAIGPVVATALLIVVTVVALVSFQNWYQTYQTGMQAKAESGNNNINGITIQRLEADGGSNAIFITNFNSDYYIVNQIKLNDIDCTLNSNVIAEEQTSQIIIQNCYISPDNVAEIAIFTDEGIFSEKHIVR